MPLRDTTVVPVTMATTSCPSGMEYRKCGPICRRTCFSLLDSCFSLRCSSGCFCPNKQMEHEGACVDECPGMCTRPVRKQTFRDVYAACVCVYVGL